MKSAPFLCASFLCLGFFLLSSCDESATEAPLASSFRTSSDIANSTDSNVTIKNLGDTKTVYGLFLQTFASTTSDCTSPTIILDAPPLQAKGAMFSAVVLPTEASISVGKNYLYNMILTGIYAATQTDDCLVDSVCPSCTLPGCKWATDPGSAVSWCIKIGVIAPQTPFENTSTVPYAVELSGEGFDYDAVTNAGTYVYVGPITCNDSTLECSVATAQEQTIP